MHQVMAALLSPIVETWRGVRAFPAGFTWLLRHPRYLTLLMVPSILAFGLLIGLWGEILDLSQWFVGIAYWDKPQAWYWLALWWVGWALLSFVPIAVSVLGIYLLMKILASPLIEWVSIAIEKDITGLEPPHLTLRQQITVIWGELQKAVVILVVPILLLLIPGFNVISLPAAAFLIGWDFFDYPLARRGWSFRERWRFVAGELWSVLGFGLWFIIPFLNILLAPFAIAGGTMLGVECISRRTSLQRKRNLEVSHAYSARKP